MVKKSIIEDVHDAFGIKFDREAFAKNYAEAKAVLEGPKPTDTVERLTKRETYANIYAQDNGRETLADAIGSPTPGVFFGVRGLHHAVTQYLRGREKDNRRRHLLVA